MMGIFVVLEGVDYTGKTTLMQNLKIDLEKKHLRVVTTLEPGETAIGKQLRPLLLHSATDILPATELLLFLADRYQHFNTFIHQHLQTADVVICDRYFYSSFVYQGLMKGVAWDLILDLHQQFGLLKRCPDLIFFLESDPITLVQRQKMQRSTNPDFDRFDSQGQNVTYFQQIQNFYHQTFKRLKPYYGELKTINPSASLTTLVKDVMTVLHRKCTALPT